MEGAQTDQAVAAPHAGSDDAPDGNAVAEAVSVPLRSWGLAAALAAAVAAAALSTYSSAAEGAIAAFIAAVVVALAASDLLLGSIPTRLVVPATAIVLLARLAYSPDQASVFVLVPIGAGLVFFGANLVSTSLVGTGDARFAVFLGAAMGYAAIGAVVVAFFAMFPFALATVVRRGHAGGTATIPFGPFLALGTLAILIVPRLIGLEGT